MLNLPACENHLNMSLRSISFPCRSQPWPVAVLVELLQHSVPAHRLWLHTSCCWGERRRVSVCFVFTFHFVWWFVLTDFKLMGHQYGGESGSLKLVRQYCNLSDRRMSVLLLELFYQLPCSLSCLAHRHMRTHTTHTCMHRRTHNKHTRIHTTPEFHGQT